MPSRPQRPTLMQTVLIVLALAGAAASIVVGFTLKDMLRIQKQVADLKEYEMAYQAFKLHYRAMPGDFRDARTIWKDGVVKNGNGNGRYDGEGFNGELPQAFIHLSRAGLVAPQFDGTFRLGQGYPSVLLAPGKGMVLRGALPEAERAGEVDMMALPKPKAAMYLQVARPAEPALPEAVRGDGLFSAQVLEKLDLKMDDGLPQSGHFRGYRAPATAERGDCLKRDGADKIYYAIDKNGKNCDAVQVYEF